MIALAVAVIVLITIICLIKACRRYADKPYYQAPFRSRGVGWQVIQKPGPLLLKTKARVVDGKISVASCPTRLGRLVSACRIAEVTSSVSVERAPDFLDLRVRGTNENQKNQ